jgi:hypothetical protein
MKLSAAAVSLLLPLLALSTPTDPSYYTDQLIDHADPYLGTYTQRYYKSVEYFKGPGNPIFMVMGGEGGIEPSTGLFYPFVNEVLAEEYNGAVIQPEHRFYGESQPAEKSDDNLKRLMTPSQALDDAARFAKAFQEENGCGERGKFVTPNALR